MAGFERGFGTGRWRSQNGGQGCRQGHAAPAPFTGGCSGGRPLDLLVEGLRAAAGVAVLAGGGTVGPGRVIPGYGDSGSLLGEWGGAAVA